MSITVRWGHIEDSAIPTSRQIGLDRQSHHAHKDVVAEIAAL
jgi:hypothetical protein